MLDKKLLSLLGKEKKLIVYITILQIIGLILTVSISMIMCIVLYQIITFNEYKFLYLLFVVAVIILIKLFITRIIGKFQSIIADSVEISLRNKINEKILSQHKEFRKYNSQALSQLSVEGIEQLNLYYTIYIPQFFYSLISPLILFIIFCFISWEVAIIFLVCVPLIPMSIIAISKYAKKIFAKYWDKYLAMGGEFLDSIKGLKELKIFLYDEKRGTELDLKAEEFRKITMKVLVMQLWSTAIMDFVAFGGAALGLTVALLNLRNGTISSGFLALFIIIVGAEFFLPMRALGSAFHISMNGATAGKKILEILNEKEEEDGKTIIDRIDSITFEDVYIDYGKEKIIKSFSASINSFGLYGLVGESGSGKSTILKLFSKECKASFGKCLINETNIEEVKEESLYQKLCFISYQSHIFSKTLRENFLIVNPLAKEEDMYNALKLVGLENFPLDFKFQEDSSNVSGGQKQRFILAFYLTREYDAYLLDEVTSNIDFDSEKIIIDIIKEISKKKIVIMISHRLENVVDAKQIFFINQNKKVTKGLHNELLENEEYKSLYKLQKDLERRGINEQI